MRYGEAEIPVEAQRTGCECHVLHPDLVPWEIKNSNEEFTAIYIIDGQEVRNGAPDARTCSSEELLDGTWKDVDTSFGPFGV